MLLNDLEDFVVVLDNVLRWGTGHFQESVVVRLEKVAEKIGKDFLSNLKLTY
jgi:hypothetical protein